MRQYFLKGFWVSLYSICLAPVFAQTLFTYGSKQASVKGFIRAFEKNPGEGDRRKALEEYLPLYINYVLKVQDAYDKKLDTFSAQKAELMRYKLQLAESYIADKSGGESLTDEAIERMQTEILLGHILIEYTNKDTAAAIQKAEEAIRQLRAGKSWSDVAAQYATDASIKKNKGVAGWIGPFSIPYAYENLVYNLPKGKYTEYIRASQGIHIFSKLDTRPGSGTVEVAQILLTFFPTMTAGESAQRGRLADSIYNLLKAGENFETLVGTFSEDRTSKFQQGFLQPFSTGTYDTRFEQEAFALKKPGDFSKPFQTGYGWHILKLVSRKAPPEKEDSEARALISQRIANDGRLENARENYYKKLLPSLKYKAGAITGKDLQVFTDSLVFGGNVNALVARNPSVMSLGSTPYYLADWVAFVRVQQNAGILFFRRGFSGNQFQDMPAISGLKWF
jgi:peptidyl-prolyl cis-trans isomerase SurA